MARNVYVNKLVGNYADGTNLLPLMKSTITAELSSIGITGQGSPNIYMVGVNGVCTSGASFKISDISKITATQYNGTQYQFEVGLYSDNLHSEISEFTLITDTASATTNVRLNFYYFPIGGQL